MLCAPTMQQRTSRVKCAAMAFQRCGGHPTALKTNRASHRMLWSCRLHTEYHLQASATSNKHKNIMQPQRLQSRYVSEDPSTSNLPATCAVQTIACSLDAQKHRVIRCDCRSQHASDMHHWFELACACQSKVVPPAWQEYGAFPTSS